MMSAVLRRRMTLCQPERRGLWTTVASHRVVPLDAHRARSVPWAVEVVTVSSATRWLDDVGDRGDDPASVYEVTLTDGAVEVVPGADAYQQEGPLTTFFVTPPGREVVDCWARRLASYRTAAIVKVRRRDLDHGSRL